MTEFLGRGRYERTGEPVAYRNGYEPTTVRATAGPIAPERPRLRSAEGLRFESRIVGRGVAPTYALETLTICSFLRGLSVPTPAPWEDGEVAPRDPAVSLERLNRLIAA